jgi:hypothetical protein
MLPLFENLLFTFDRELGLERQISRGSADTEAVGSGFDDPRAILPGAELFG